MKVINKKLVKLLFFWCSISLVPIVAKADSLSDILDALSNINGSVKGEYPDASKNLNTIHDLNDKIKSATEGQLTEINREWAALSQSYGMGQFSTTNSFSQDAELWSQDTWEDALKAASGNNYSRYNELKAAYALSNPIINTSAPVDEDLLVKNTYQMKSDTTNTSLAASQYVYEEINKHIKAINELKARIDDPSNQNMKAAVDLNSRIQAEQAQLQVEMLKLQAVQAQVQAVNSQEELNAATLDKQFMGYNIN